MYEVYALKYGERDSAACQLFYREASHELITLHFYVWLILGGPHPVLLDTGSGEEEATSRGLCNYVSPATMVERAGIKPADIPVALVSHLHWDHWAGHALFPSAQFWIQRDEVAFWTGPVARHIVFQRLTNAPALSELVRLNDGNRVHLVEREREVLPGLRLHWVGGHTAGLQVVSVQTARGTVVLTSDASPFYRNVERRQPVQIITNLPQMLAAFDTIDALAGAGRLIVPGHDPQVSERFTPVEPGIIRIA